MSHKFTSQGIKKKPSLRSSIAAVMLTCVTTASIADDFSNWESPHVHPIDRTPDGTTLLAVNTANHSLEVFDISEDQLSHRVSIPVGLDPVTVRARTNNEVWVVNHVSDSVSVIDLSRATVIDVLETEDEPADVVFSPANGRAFVSCSQDNSMLVFNTNNLDADPTRLSINGEDPRSLSISPDGSTVYAAIFESGNATTILAGGRRNPQPGNVVDDPRGPYGGVNPPPNRGNEFFPPISPDLPTPPRVGMIVQKDEQGRWMDDNNGDWSTFVSGELANETRRVQGWDMPDRDVAVIDTQSLSITYQHGVMNALMSSAVNPATGELTIVGTDANNRTRFVNNVASHFIDVEFATITRNGEVEVTNLNPHLSDGVIRVPMNDRLTSIGDPRGLAWEQSGNLGYVVGMGSNNVLLVNDNGQRIDGIEPLAVGEGPTGIVLNEALNNAYVLNRFDGSISIVDTENFSELSQVDFFDPTPDEIKQGRPFLYNTHISSGRGQIACGSCHIDGRYDRLAWNLDNPQGRMLRRNNVEYHPMKGPMRTTSLVGVTDGNLLHFRGDANSVRDFAVAFDGLQGLGTPMSQDNMALLEGFLGTVLTPPNPYRELDNSMPDRIEIPGPGNRAGNPNEHRNGTFCAPCHAPATGGRDSVVRPRPGNTAGDQPAISPSLRSMYEVLGMYYNSVDGSNAGYGFIHDGSFDIMTGGTLSVDNNLAFMMAFNGDLEGDTHAAVGRQVLVQPDQRPVGSALLNQLRALADANAIALVAKGNIGGQSRAYMYLGNGQYQSDSLFERVSHAQLLAQSASSNMPLVFTAVPFNSKERMSIDTNDNGILDGDEGSNIRLREVAITNPSFEAQRLQGATPYTRGNITGWTVRSSQAGIWHPAVGRFNYVTEVQRNIAYIDNGGTISQTLAERFNPNSMLRLRVLVGDQAGNGDSNAWAVRLYAGSQLLGAMDNSVVNPADDTFAEGELVLRPDQLAAFANASGQPLRVELFDAGSGDNVYFDNIRLAIASDGATVEPPPVEPPAQPYQALIRNPGFEQQVFANGGFALNNVAGWQVNSARAGVWNATSGSYPNEAPQGQNVVFIDVGGSISQVLQERLTAGTSLRLSALVGDERAASQADGWALRLYAGNQLLGQVTNANFNPADGRFVRATLALSAQQLNAFAANYGQALRIELFDNGRAANVHFDDVRLTVSPEGSDTGGVQPPQPPVAATNLARGARASQSSNYSRRGVAANAVDGNRNGNYRDGSVTHTRSQNMPWWQVDLGASNTIETIRLFNREDCCTARLRNLYVLVSDRPFVSNNLNAMLNQSGVRSFRHPGVAGRQTDFSINATGRYVRVVRAERGILSLAEVEVIGRPR